MRSQHLYRSNRPRIPLRKLPPSRTAHSPKLPIPKAPPDEINTFRSVCVGLHIFACRVRVLPGNPCGRFPYARRLSATTGKPTGDLVILRGPCWGCRCSSGVALWLTVIPRREYAPGQCISPGTPDGEGQMGGGQGQHSGLASSQRLDASADKVDEARLPNVTR